MLKKIARKMPFFNEISRPYHLIRAWRAADKFDYPASAMKVIGITGTNGKTTTCFFVYNMLKNAGKKVCLMSTAGFATWQSDEIFAQTAHATTENPEILNKHLAEFRDAGCEFLVLEITSHALSQSRIFGIPIDVAIFTNLSHEHLDYHKTMKKYREAKEKLFKICAKTRGGKKLGIINADDETAKFFARDVPNVLTYGMKNGEIIPRQTKISAQGLDYFVKFDFENSVLAKILADENAKNLKNSAKILREKSDEKNDQKSKNNFTKNQNSAQESSKNSAGFSRKISARKLHIKTQISGSVNVYNSLAAVCAGLSYNLTNEEIERGIFGLTSVEGRMNSISEGQNFDVIIDFAHTPDAYAKLFPDFRAAAKNRVIAVFGSAGERDATKRPEMGEIAAKFADLVIITEDDPRGKVRPISEEIAAGAKKSGKILDKNLFLIDNRGSAIEFAFRQAKSGDLVVLLGKGHEKTIARAGGDEPWNEAEVAREILRKMGKSAKKS